MKNARTETAARGYVHYLRQDRKGTLPDLKSVNAALAAEGLEPVHQCSITHYENLRQHGITKYMPINQFDVKRNMGLL